MRPSIQLESDDFNGYFVAEVEAWLDRHKDHNFKIDTIILTIGPYRAYDVHWQISDNKLHLDFYSVARFHSVGVPDELIEFV